MLYWFEHFGVAVGALSGVLAARGKRVDLFAVIVLAVVAAFGGGTIRDVVLDVPVFWVKDGNYIFTAMGTAIVAFFAARVHVFSGRALVIADAVVLAFFTMLGVKKAMLLVGAPAPVALTMGVVTGVAGGIFRDILISEIPLVFRTEIYFYATASICGGITYLVLHHYLPEMAQFNLLAGFAVTLGLRLAALRWKLKLPVFTHRDDSAI
jgi:uncharacterized membrane protein YeiH